MPSEKEFEALEAAQGLDPTPGNISRLYSRFGDAGRWAFTQITLREKATEKFRVAAHMLFTREALEQATHESIAAYHAAQFPPKALVADLTVGIGADLMALARRGPTIGFDTSAERLAYARHNLAVAGLESQWLQGDCLAAEWGFEYAFADPARRVEGVRTIVPSAFSPDPQALAARMQSLKKGAIKLTPMLEDRFLESLGPGLEFISFGRECREALVWTGTEVGKGREAVHIESGQRLAATHEPKEVDTPGEFFYEADPAAIRAHALGAFGLEALGSSNGYLTGTLLGHSPWLTPYRVLYHGKADLKTTIRALADLRSAVPELKQRGIKQDLQAIRRGMAHHGQRQTCVAIWPVGASLRHTVIERIAS